MNQVTYQQATGHIKYYLGQYWPYLIFSSLVVVYNVLYLPLGFNPSLDEGYLQSLACRILDGELPYRDFYFFRTPLSIYIQGTMIGLLGNHYTLMAGRIFCVFQTTTMVLLVSSVYYRLVNKMELLLLLIASYQISTLMLDFPWYSYDAAFFAAVGLVMFHRRSFLLFGVAVFLAGLCKQNYAGLLILVPLLSIAGRMLNKDLELVRPKEMVRYLSGFALAGLGYGVLLLATDRVGAFFQNIIFLPREITPLTLPFTLFQNHADAFGKSVALIFLVTMLFYANRNRWLLYAGAGIAGVLFVSNMWDATYDYSYAMVYFSYTIAALALLNLTDKERDGPSSDSDTIALWKLFAVSLIIQYLAGFNYSGLAFSHIGAGVGTPLAFILLSRMKGSARFRLPLYLLLSAVIVIGYHIKTRSVYQDGSLSNLTREFSHPMLKGVYSSPANVETYEQVLAAVSEYTEPNDPIFVFPNHPSLYFLTGRRNPTPVQWYYSHEYNGDILNEAIEDLRNTPPKLCFSQMSKTPKALADFLNAEYRRVGGFGQLDVFVPREIPARTTDIQPVPSP